MFFPVDAALDARIARLGVVTSNSGQRVLIDASTIADAVFQVVPVAWLLLRALNSRRFACRTLLGAWRGGPRHERLLQQRSRSFEDVIATKLCGRG